MQFEFDYQVVSIDQILFNVDYQYFLDLEIWTIMRKATNKKIEIANLSSSNIILTHLFILLKKLNQYPRLLTPKSIADDKTIKYLRLLQFVFGYQLSNRISKYFNK